MVQAEGVEVYVTRFDDKTRYAEYVVPKDSPAYTGCSNEVYIEAETGARFAIVVRRGSEFKWLRRSYIMAVCYVSANVGISKITQSSAAKGPCSSNSKVTFDSCNKYINGIEHRCGYTFSELSLGESVHCAAGSIVMADNHNR